MSIDQLQLQRSALRSQRVRPLINERGAILLLVAVSMVAMMGLLVMVVDGGALQRRKRMAQAAADAGALAGANEIFRSRPTGEIEPSAKRETLRNGFAHNVNNVLVTVTYPTTSVNSPGSGYVRVRVEQTLPTIFGGLLDRWTGTVAAEAVGGVGVANNCLVLLEPSAPAVLSVTASATLTANQCGIAINSTSSQAIEIKGGQSEIAAGSVAVTGPQPNPGGISGSYQSGVPPTPDPLGYLTMPAVGACNAGSAGANYGAYSDYGGGTLSPGVYCGGIGFDNGVTVTLLPGTYFLAGGGLDIKHGTLIGAGVTIINTNAPDNDPAKFAPFTFEVNSDVTLSACTTYDATLCPLPGILFYQDPAAPAVDPSTGEMYVNVLRSNSATSLMGSVYFPTQAISGVSSTTLTINGGVVAARLELKTGTEQFVINGFGGGAGNNALKKPTIVE